MAKYRGSRGFVAFGGVVNGTPLLMGARPAGATSATFDGTSLTGALLAGDQFTVAGSGVVHTIAADVVIGATTPNQVAVTFTPAVAAGGWSDNAAVSFVSNSVAQTRKWEATPSRPYLDGTCQGDSARNGTLDTPMWSGKIEALLDYADPQHKEFIDEVRQNNTPAGIGCVLGVVTDKAFYGHIMPTNARIVSERGALVTVGFDFEGEGALGLDW